MTHSPDWSDANKVELASVTVPEGRLITARSHLIDRIVADCEIVHLPEKDVAGGVIHWRKGDIVAEPPKARRSVLRRAPGTQSGPPGRWIFDARHRTPENWAHFLNNYVPLIFCLAAQAGYDPGDAAVLLPAKTPGYIQDAARLLGIEALLTDETISGEGIAFDVSPWTALRTARADWMRLPKAQEALAAALAEPASEGLPKRFFLSRRDSRTIENEAVIASLLEAKGFMRVFAEDLSAADQIRLFQGAEAIVAVHGAGLAPLLFCAGGRGPEHLIEILPCGHMTDVYRVMAAQVGCGWIGVRGRIKPEYVQPAYELEKAFTKYSLDSFPVDPVSLERAFDMVGL